LSQRTAAVTRLKKYIRISTVIHFFSSHSPIEHIFIIIIIIIIQKIVYR
jgi:hypothetical protein